MLRKTCARRSVWGFLQSSAPVHVPCLHALHGMIEVTTWEQLSSYTVPALHNYNHMMAAGKSQRGRYAGIAWYYRVTEQDARSHSTA